MASDPSELDAIINEYADYWRTQIGVNVIPADTRNKTTYTKWSEYQENPIPQLQHDEWKADHSFRNGMAIIPGRIWHIPEKRDLYLTFLDIDRQQGIEDVCTRNGKEISLQHMAEKFLVEQHSGNLQKAHIYFYSPIQFHKKSSDEVLGLEVKGIGIHGIAFCSPSMHKDGTPYTIIGTRQPVTLTTQQAREMIQHLNQICMKYGIQYLGKDSSITRSLRNIVITLRLDENIRIPEGQRHSTMISVADSLLFNYLGQGKHQKPEKWLRYFFDQINNQLCEPEPLPRTEINNIWKSALEFVTKIRAEEKEGENDGETPEENDDRSPSEILLDLALKCIPLLFNNQYSTAYALVQFDDHNETVKIDSSKFRRYLSRLYFDATKKVIHLDTINSVIYVLQANAEYKGPTIPLSLRVAWHEGSIYYDMTDSHWRAIRITKERWNLVDKTPVPLFMRYNQNTQTEPDHYYEEDIFERFLQLTNITEEADRILLKVYIISMFIPEIPHPILMLHGEKGSAKSTLQTLIKLLVDPGKPTLLTIHTDKNEFVQQLGHNYVVYYDNVRYTPGWLSDEACKAVTGVGQTKRKLYTDDDDIVYEYRRCLGFNGIILSLMEPDALDRSIMIELSRITREKRRPEADIISEFGKLRPRLLGYIFDIVAKAIALRQEIRLDDLPRMADFALWGESISRAMGFKDLDFLNAYYKNIGRQNLEVLDNHPLGQAICRLVDEWSEDTTYWEGPTSDLLDMLGVIALNYKIDTSLRTWPKSIGYLTRRINQIRSNLLEGTGIVITISRLTSGQNQRKNTSLVRIEKVAPSAPLSPLTSIKLENFDDVSGDKQEENDCVSTDESLSPPED